MKRNGAHMFIGAVICAIALFLTPLAEAGYQFDIDDTKWISIGAGLRTSFRAVEDAAPSEDDYSTDFEVENIRLYFNGQVHNRARTFTGNYHAGLDMTQRDGIGHLDHAVKYA